jgi:hypothetical protein
MPPNLSQLRNGIYIFSYRPIERWERKLLIDNAYYGTNHSLATKTILVPVNKRVQNAIITNTIFNPKPVKEWFTYEYRTELNQIYPRNSAWFNIETPNDNNFAEFIPDIVSAGDTFVFEEHLN